MLGFYRLQIFLTVAEEGKISRASERLHLTPPAVSQHIRALERELGVTLFERRRSGVTLTPGGRAFLDYARCILRLVKEGKEAAANASGLEVAHIHLGASPGVGAFVLPRWIKSFHAHYPTISVHLRTDPTPQIVREVADGRLQLGIVEGQARGDEVEITPLWNEQIVLVVGEGHRWWERRRVSMRDLKGMPLVLRDRGSLTRAWEERTLRQYGVEPTVGAEFDSPAAIKQAILAGLGLAFLPRFAVEAEVERGQLRILTLEEGPLQRTLWLLWIENSLTYPAVNAFLTSLATEFPHLPLQIRGADDRPLVTPGASPPRTTFTPCRQVRSANREPPTGQPPASDL